MEVRDAIYGMRAIRDFTDQPVDREAVFKLINAASRAPSAVNMQPWAFVVIQDKNLLQRYSDRAKVLFDQTLDRNSGLLAFGSISADPNFNIFYNAGTLIVICAKPVGLHPEWDCCLAAQNLMLEACELGLGTCPIGFAWPLLNEFAVRQELNIASGYVPVLPIIVGYPTHATRLTPRNRPEILCWK